MVHSRDSGCKGVEKGAKTTGGGGGIAHSLYSTSESMFTCENSYRCSELTEASQHLISLNLKFTVKVIVIVES